MQKRQRAAALQDLSAISALTKSAKRLGVRLPSAAFQSKNVMGATALITSRRVRIVSAPGLALHARAAALNEGLDFFERRHRGIAGSRHRQGAMSGAIFDSFLWIVEFQETVDKA